MKIKKVVTIIIFLILVIGFAITSFAGDITNGIGISTNTTNQFQSVGNKVFSIVRVVGVISSVGALMLIGIKYMLGSVEEKAEYKKTFPIYLLGCVLVFGICTLGSLVYQWIESLPI